MTSSQRLRVGLSFLAFILLGANDGAIGVLLPSIQATYHVNKATIGLFFLGGALGYFIASFNSGLLVGRLGTRHFLLLGTLLEFIGLLTLSLRPPFIILLLGTIPIGFGGGIFDAGLNTYIAGLPRNTSLLNYLHAFYGIGALLGPIAASTLLAVQLGWNSVYFIWVGIVLLLMSGIFIAFKEQRTPTVQEIRKPGDNILALTLRLRVVWLAALFLLFYVGTEVSLGSWSYSFLTEQRHDAVLLSGWVVSGYWLGLTAGRLTLARLAQRIGGRRLIEGCLVGVVAGVLLVWLVPTQAASAIGLCLTGYCLGPIFPTTIALMSTLVSGRLLPSAIGFLASLGSMGAALYPWLAGNLVQRVGLWALLPYVIVLTAVMLVLWVLLQGQRHPSHAGTR